ncbi:MAG: DUF4422 domain-containing protein [Clostridiales bacterium]|nr:DUF4422 domain-containing protein [Clostridiales bacterium]
MSGIKILICYHKKAPLFKDDILTPIHVGRANAKKRLDHSSENYQWLMSNMIGDDTGDNISDENDSYNEMTAIYWVWKNYDKLGNPDYIGLAHYRRHFVLNDVKEVVYNIRDFDESNYFERIGYSEENMHRLVDGCDFVAHMGRVNNVYRHFVENQRKTDIDLANEIVLEQHPDYKDLMDEYYAGDDSNFCNMNIFSKKLFFDYCEWIFPILEEFKTRVSVDEKRFFISERLTGIYMAHLMKDESLKYKTVPISFIDEPVEVAVAIRPDEENPADAAVTISSIMRNSTGYHSYHFYLLTKSTDDPQAGEEYRKLCAGFEKCTLDLIETDAADDYLPLVLSDYLPQKIKKVIYISGTVVSMFDIGEFFHVSSVDDYYMIGIPEKQYDPEEEEKRVDEQLLVINCKRMRDHQVSAAAEEMMKNHRDGQDALNEICRYQIGYIPWYYFTSERLSGYAEKLFHEQRHRGTIQQDACYRPFLIYDYNRPVENNQNVFSIFWWKIFAKMPLYFQRTTANLDDLESVYQKQQIEINQYGEAVLNEEWRNYGLVGKLKFYYDHNGLKKTIIYLAKKPFSVRKG